MIDNWYFVDGFYLRKYAEERRLALINPRKLLAHAPLMANKTFRVTYFDGYRENEGTDDVVEEYWDRIACQDFTELGFGWMRRTGCNEMVLT